MEKEKRREKNKTMWTKGNKPELDATKVPTALDIAWSAGIYEGEGSCRLCGKTKRGFMVSVAQKDPELLYRLRDWFGGSIQDQNPNHECYVWNACGDRARIFIALVYDVMTSRRKSQIEATGALDFLRGTYPAGLSIVHLKSIMFEYYEQEKWSKTERAKARRAKRYVDQSSDPEWMKQTLEYNSNARANWTEEQREAARQYQREYYQKKKNKQLLNIVEMKKTA